MLLCDDMQISKTRMSGKQGGYATVQYISAKPESHNCTCSQKQKAKIITYDPLKKIKNKKSTNISHNKQCSQEQVGRTPLYVHFPCNHQGKTTLKYIHDKHHLNKHMNLTMYGLCLSVPTYWVNRHART